MCLVVFAVSCPLLLLDIILRWATAHCTERRLLLLLQPLLVLDLPMILHGLLVAASWSTVVAHGGRRRQIRAPLRIVEVVYVVRMPNRRDLINLRFHHFQRRGVNSVWPLLIRLHSQLLLTLIRMKCELHRVLHKQLEQAILLVRRQLTEAD